MARESLSPAESQRREFDELKTIQLLEETLGPKGLRQLRHAYEDEAARQTLESVARSASDDLRELDDVIHEWSRLESREGAKIPTHAEGLERAEVLASIVELKESEAQMMRRAAERAPTQHLRDRLTALADRQSEAAEKLKALL